MRINTSRPNVRPGLAEQEGHGLCRSIGRLHPQHDLQMLMAGLKPRKAAFWFEEHWINGPRLEPAVEHQHVRRRHGEGSADFLAKNCPSTIGILHGRVRLPDGPAAAILKCRADPPLIDRRVGIPLAVRTCNPRESQLRVIGCPLRACLSAKPQWRSVAERHPRPVVGIEALEEEERQRLAEIEGRRPDRAEQVALIKRWDTKAAVRDLRGRYHELGARVGVQTANIKPFVDVARIGASHQQRVRCLFGPSRHVGGAEVRGV